MTLNEEERRSPFRYSSSDDCSLNLFSTGSFCSLVFLFRDDLCSLVILLLLEERFSGKNTSSARLDVLFEVLLDVSLELLFELLLGMLFEDFLPPCL